MQSKQARVNACPACGMQYSSPERWRFSWQALVLAQRMAQQIASALSPPKEPLPDPEEGFILVYDEVCLV